jgi:hypothetical protein
VELRGRKCHISRSKSVFKRRGERKKERISPTAHKSSGCQLRFKPLQWLFSKPNPKCLLHEHTQRERNDPQMAALDLNQEPNLAK